jgi:hypothetical protein
MAILTFCFCVIGILGALVGVFCGLWCLGMAFRTNVWWGLAYMFIPFAGLAFVISHWDEVGKPFLYGFCGFTLAAIISMALPGARGGMPHLGGFGGEASSEVTRRNMKMVQMAAESYGVDHSGSYPPNLELFKCYFPQGHPPSMDGKAPTNPVTKEPEWPLDGSVTEVAAARAATPGPLKAGAVEYSVIYDASHHAISYAVRGGDADGKALADRRQKGTLVLSNQ